MGFIGSSTSWLVPIAFLWTTWSSLFDSCAWGIRSINSQAVEDEDEEIVSVDVHHSGTVIAGNSSSSPDDKVLTSKPRALTAPVLNSTHHMVPTSKMRTRSQSSPVFFPQNPFGYTRLGRAIAARAEMISGENEWEIDVDTNCFIHAVPKFYERLVETLNAIEHRCSARLKQVEELHREVYRMVNNQLPLDNRRGPYAISYPRSHEDMQDVILVAKNMGWKVYIIGGGHSADAWGFNEGMVISMLFRRDVTVVHGRALGWDGQALKMEAGAVWAEAYLEAHRARQLLMGGSCATVGVVGYYLGGGFGYLSGSLGFGADNVLRFTVVTADGRVLHADRNNNADLFNALRGGGHLGLAAVSEVYVKLHPWHNFGCLFKIQLAYSALPSDMSWVDRLVKMSPRAIHLRFQSGTVIRFRVSVTFLSDSSAPTRSATAAQLAALLKSSEVPLPDGPFCTENWLDCLLGTEFKPTGLAHCRLTGQVEDDFDQDSGEMDIPDTLGQTADDWGLKETLHGVFASNQPAMYLNNYQHRTSTKSLLIKKITPKFFEAVLAATLSAEPDWGVYIAIYWWGGGLWAGNAYDGSVSDAHRPYSWLVIISSDFRSEELDTGALEWTTRTWDTLAELDGETPQPHPNLYDRLHVHRHSSRLQTKRDGLVALGHRAGQAVRAKIKYDPTNLFHMPA